MRNFLRLAQGANVMPLLLALHRLEKSEGIWKADTYRRKYAQGPTGDVQSVILRFPPRDVDELERAFAAGEPVDQHECEDKPPYKQMPEARPLVFALMAYVQGERLGRVLINKIRPGGRVYPHKDQSKHANYWDRFHVVLQSAPGVTFRAGVNQVFMAPGETWWFDNSVEHEVVNNSAEDRIHMVVDIRTSK